MVIINDFGEFLVFLIFILANIIKDEIQIESDAREADMVSAINIASLMGLRFGIYIIFVEYSERIIIDENKYSQAFFDFIRRRRGILEVIIIIFSIY